MKKFLIGTAAVSAFAILSACSPGNECEREVMYTKDGQMILGEPCVVDFGAPVQFEPRHLNRPDRNTDQDTPDDDQDDQDDSTDGNTSDDQCSNKCGSGGGKHKGPKGNNGWGNGDDHAPGNSGNHNNAENGNRYHHKHGNSHRN